jgi:hypothetical protein
VITDDLEVGQATMTHHFRTALFVVHNTSILVTFYYKKQFKYVAGCQWNGSFHPQCNRFVYFSVVTAEDRLLAFGYNLITAFFHNLYIQKVKHLISLDKLLTPLKILSAMRFLSLLILMK